MVSSYGTAITSTVGRLFIQATRGNKVNKDPIGRNLVCSVSSCKKYILSNFYLIILHNSFGYALTGNVVVFNQVTENPTC